MIRFATAISRAEVTDSGVLRGYAAVYDQPTTRQAQYPGSETIGRGAFDGLFGGDVVALVNHDMSLLLGRTESGTLRLDSDDHGLRFELALPDTQLGRDVRTLVQRGDMRGMSFTAQPGEIERTASGVVHRRFTRLVDVSVVANPAYTGTEVVARNAGPVGVREQSIRARARVLFGGSDGDVR